MLPRGGSDVQTGSERGHIARTVLWGAITLIWSSEAHLWLVWIAVEPQRTNPSLTFNGVNFYFWSYLTTGLVRNCLRFRRFKFEQKA